jgi:hypothetical protein
MRPVGLLNPELATIEGRAWKERTGLPRPSLLETTHSVAAAVQPLRVSHEPATDKPVTHRAETSVITTDRVGAHRVAGLEGAVLS